MGSLVSRPKAPKVRRPPAFIPVQAPTPTSAASIIAPAPAAISAGAETPAVVPADDIAAKSRELGLLNRSRGRLSTVLTGFRGILGQAVAAPQRKTLLGE